MVEKMNEEVKKNVILLQTAVVIIILLLGVIPLVAQAGSSTLVQINPVSTTVSTDQTFTINVICTPGQSIKSFEFKVSFNSTLLQANAVSEGTIFNGYTTFFNAGIINNTAGTIINVYGIIQGVGVVSNQGSLVSLSFTARSASGVSTVGLYGVGVTNETHYVPITVMNGGVTISIPSNSPPSSHNQPPFSPMKPQGPIRITVGVLYMYNSSAVDPDGDRVRLRFDWGDGSLSSWTEFVASNTLVYVSHAWMNVSNSTLRVIAQDPDGVNSSWSELLMVRVSQEESKKSIPVGMFTVSKNTSSNQTIIFNASNISDSDGEIVSYHWDFGDRTTGVGKNPMHTYQFPGTYTVTLTIIDNTGMTGNLSKVISIVAGSEAQTGNEKNFLQSNSNLIILTAVAIPLLIPLLFYRDEIEEVYVQKRIETYRRRLALGFNDTSEIDQILDKLCLGMNHKIPILTNDSILAVYSEMIIEKVEKNTAYHPPNLSINEIENLVNRRIQYKIEEEVDIV
jgi:PKD repeat protein